jgi:hypothetical protein
MWLGVVVCGFVGAVVCPAFFVFVLFCINLTIIAFVLERRRG